MDEETLHSVKRRIQNDFGHMSAALPAPTFVPGGKKAHGLPLDSISRYVKMTIGDTVPIGSLTEIGDDADPAIGDKEKEQKAQQVAQQKAQLVIEMAKQNIDSLFSSLHREERQMASAAIVVSCLDKWHKDEDLDNDTWHFVATWITKFMKEKIARHLHLPDARTPQADEVPPPIFDNPFTKRARK